MDNKDSLLNQWLNRLAQVLKDARQLFAFFQEIIDKVDNVNDSTNKEFTRKFLPELDNILKLYPPQFEENSVQCVRNVVLKFFQKICNHSLQLDQLQQVYNSYPSFLILDRLIVVVEHDNEENALLGLKIIQDVLQKNMQIIDSGTMEKIESYLFEQYKEFENKYKRNFEEDEATHFRDHGSSVSPYMGPASAPSLTAEGDTSRRSKTKAASRDSFKIVAEIYFITVITMGLCSRKPKQKMLDFVPYIVSALCKMPSKEMQARKKDKFIDFLIAQNKMYSIVGYLLRVPTAGESLGKYSQDIADSSVRFLKNCPPEHSSARKTFLGTLKFLIIQYIDAYLKHFKDILDFNVLLGEYNERQDLRAEASSIILNVAQYTKEKLSMEQRELIIHDLLRMINDITITVNLQGSAVLALNKYIDIISKMPECPRILMEVVQILTLKFKFLDKYLPKSYYKKMNQRATEDKKKSREIKVLTKILKKDESKIEEDEARLDENKELEFYVDTCRNYLKIENDRDRDISDLLRETKQLVQKMIALMQSVINTLCDNRNGATPSEDCQLTEERLEQLSKLFHYGIKYFVTKTAIYRLYGKNIAAESEDMDKNVKLFMEIFVRLDLASFGQIIERQIGFLCKCITKPKVGKQFKGLMNDDKKVHDNEFLSKIPQYMRDELSKAPAINRDKLQVETMQSYSALFAHILAKYLLTKLKNIGGYNKMKQEMALDSQKYSRTLSLFKIVMEIFARLEGNENIYSFYFNFIVLSAKYSRKAKSFYHYFSVIKSVCRSFKDRQGDPPKEFAYLLPGLLTIILKVKQECAVLNELLTEICQYLPVIFKTLVEYLPVLVRPLIDCISPIKIANNIAGNAIKSFDQWFGALSHLPELLDTLYNPILPEFITSLHKLFSYQHYTPSIHRILGRLGGKSRLYMNDKEAYTKSYPDEGLRMSMFERTTRRKVITGMDVGLDASFRYLESTSKIKPENVKSIYKLVKAAYYAFMDDSFDAAYINECYVALTKKNYKELKQIAEKYAADAFKSNQTQMRVTSMKRDSQRHALEKLLTEIFYMTAVYYTRDGYTKKLLDFFYFVCEHLVLIGLCRNGTLTIGKVDEIDPLTYLNVITEFLNESKDTVYPSQKNNQITYVAIDAIKHIAETYKKIFVDSPSTLNNVQLLDLLIRKIYALCYWKEWMKKEGSSLALSALIDILPADFFKKYELPIIKALIYSLNTLPEFITVTAHINCPSTLNKLIDTCHAQPHFVLKAPHVIAPSPFLMEYIKSMSTAMGTDPSKLENEFVSDFREICRRFTQELRSERKFSRKTCRECLALIAQKEHLPLDEILNIDAAKYCKSVSETTEMITEVETTSKSELERIKDSLFEKRWSEDFKSYDYSGISAGLDCFSYLLKKDQGGNLIGNSSDLGAKLLELNEELLIIIREEILSYEELRRTSSDQSVKSYYMLLEKKHNYLHPVYEYSTGAIYNHLLKTEKERYESRRMSVQAYKERAQQSKHPPGKANYEERLINFTAQVMTIKEYPIRQNLLKSDYYIYKVFPKSEARIKAVCMCLTVLSEEYLKALKDKDWHNSTMTTEEMKFYYYEQRSKYIVTLFKLLMREEKCIHRKAKECIKILYENSKDEEILPDKIFKECIKLTLTSKITDLNEYKKIMHLVKLFPKYFAKGLWEKISESFRGIINKLSQDKPHKSEGTRNKHNLEFHVSCYLISCYRYKYVADDDIDVFKNIIEQVSSLKNLIYAYGTPDILLKNPLAHLFNRFDEVLLKYIKELHSAQHSEIDVQKIEFILKLTASVIEVKKAQKFRECMLENASPLLSEILLINYREPGRYNLIHEVLAIIYALHKSRPTWVKTQQSLIHQVCKAWLSIIPSPGTHSRVSWHFQEDFLKVEKLLLGYTAQCPADVEAAYLILEFIKSPEYVYIHELRQFLSYDLCQKMPNEAYKLYVERYLALINNDTIDEKLCLSATSYLMIPLFFFTYRNKNVDDAFGKDLEEKLLNMLFSSKNWKPIIQRRLLRFGVLILEHIAKDKMDSSKKTVVMDIWKKIKSDDAGMKAWGFLALAKFANKIQMPNERIQEVIYVFFGENHGDNRDVVCEAMDSVVPVMFQTAAPPQHDQNLFLLEKTIRINAASVPSLTNVFGMVVRNQAIFRPYKVILYPRMIQAFQKIFFYSKPLQSKVLAFDLAKVMLLWSLDPHADPKVKETEKQIKDIVAACLFKELFQLHYIIETEEPLDKDCVELTYKCLTLLRSILMNSPEINLKLSAWDRHAPANHSREALLQVTILNAIRVVLKHCNKDRVEDYVKKYVEGAVSTLRCKWAAKVEQNSPQKHPQIIEALCNFCVLLKEKTTVYPPEWVENLRKIIAHDLELFFTEIKNFDKTSQQNREDNKSGMQERTQIKYYKEQIYFLTPHLTIRLCAIHDQMGMSSLFQEYFEQLLNCWNYLCKVFTKYLKLCDRLHDYPFVKGGGPTSPTASQVKDASLESLNKDDPGIIYLSSSGVSLDYYIRETIIKATHFLANRIIENPRHASKYFDTLINAFEKECIDETVLIEIVKAARTVIMSNAQLSINIDQVQGGMYPGHSSQGDKSKLIGRLQERMPAEFEQASAEVFEFAYEYLSNAPEFKDHHKKIHNYSLMQLRNKSLSIRNKYFSLFDKYYGRSVFKRLQHIFLQQTWDYAKDAKDNFWIQQALDLLLSSIDDNASMQREQDGVVLLSFGKNVSASSEIMSGVLPAELERIIVYNKKVASKLKNKKTKYWLNPLKDVTNWEHHICEKLWLKLFPQFWGIMTADEQQQIACLIEPFLSRDEFLKQMQGKRPNAIKTMFEAVSACDPIPKMSPEVIQYIGKSYSAWHTALPVIESYLYAFPGNERFAICMRELYKQLAEGEYAIGLQRYITKCPITQAGLTYIQFGKWMPAYELFAKAISKNIKLSSGKESIKELEPNDFALGQTDDMGRTLTQIDLRIWEDGLIESAQQLNKWEDLKMIGAHTHKMTLILQHEWAMRNWANFNATSKKVHMADTSVACLAQLYCHIQQQTNDEDTERDNIYKKGLKALYSEWNMLPTIVDAPHYPSIILQQHFLETSEFKNMYKEVRDYMQKPGETDLKLPLNHWRERLPNKCEAFSVWKDLLECRNFLFNQMLNKLTPGPKLDKVEPYLHDIPWNLLKLAEIARKHGLVEQALQYLMEVDHYLKSTGDVHNYEKFLRAKETAKIAKVFKSDLKETDDYLLSLLNKPFCQKLPMAQSEIHRLRGELAFEPLRKLTNSEEARSANKKRNEIFDAFNNAASVWPQNYKAWASYAAFCEKVFEETQEPQCNANTLKGYIRASCFMISKSKYYIPRIFCCLENASIVRKTTGETSEELVKKTFEDSYKDEHSIPFWAWIYWIPQLISNLKRNRIQQQISKSILTQIATLYPQPLFLHLHRYQEKNKDLANSALKDAYVIVKDILGIITASERDKYKTECIEKILTELEKKVLASFNKEDELLLDIRYRFTISFPLNKEAFRTGMTELMVKYFGNSNEEYKELQRLYKEKFMCDFSEEALNNAPLTKSMFKLRNWIDYLHTKVTLRTEQYSMDGYSQELASLVPKKIEMFGCNYIKDSEPLPETTIYIARLETKVEKTYQRTRVDFRGSNEKNYSYYLQMHEGNEKSEVLISQIRHILNSMFASSRHTMARNIKLYSPYSLYWGNMKMTLDEFHIMQLSDIHDAAMIERGLHPDYASISYLEKYSEAVEKRNLTEGIEAIEKDIKKSVIEDMRLVLGDYIFSAFIHKLVSNPDELFVYKKQFTTYLAAQSFFSHIFGAAHRELMNFMFCKRTGKIYFSNYAISNAASPEAEKPEARMPFRLTPNLQYFITPIGVEGPFAGTITAAALSLEGKRYYNFEGCVRLIYRDMYDYGADFTKADDMLANYARTRTNVETLLDNSVIERLEKMRHAVFKTETVKVSGGEEKREDSGEKAYWACFNQKVYTKIKEAQDVALLNEMPIEWASWF